jgi:Ni/Fe-hydrogenase subunit HybB-like protein
VSLALGHAAAAGPDPRDPVVDPAETAGSMTDTVCAAVLRKETPLWWWIMLAPSLALLGLGVIAVGWLLFSGVQAWGNNWPTVWGFELINYVWWIGIASGGTFISSLFFLLRADWRTSLSRIAETMTLFTAICAGIYPILHLGRPWYFYWLFPYPNTMTLWPQFKSPLLWDFIAILTYVISSVLFWYIGILPDLATMRDRAQGRFAQLAYGSLALGFRGSGTQWRHYRSTYATMAAIMAPLVVSVHSVVGLDFAGGETPGWHSTQFPPFFVFGAILSGFAAVLILVLPLRRLFRFEPFVTGRHIDVLCKLLLVSSLCVAYAYMMDAFSTYYGGDKAELSWFHDRLTGAHAPVYYLTLVLNCTVPQLFWWRAFRMNQVIVLLVSFSAIVGMWFERFGIVVVSLGHTELPSAWGIYHPSFWDYSLFAGTIGLFATGFLLFIRLFPMVSMFEMRELIEERAR